MTEKLFWTQPYNTEFEAKIVKITDKGVIFDKTLFYPRSGNQAEDIGQLLFNDEIFEVKHIISERNQIIHEISPKELKKFTVGAKIKGIINWERRYALMKAHTSQHILSALLKNTYQVNTLRAQIEKDEVLIILDKMLESNQLSTILIEFFSLCMIKNVEIRSKIYSKIEVRTLGNKLRGHIPENDQIRVIEIENLDFSCCGGTHVKNSTEIGPILITDFKKNKEIKYILGNRAIKILSRINTEILTITNKLNTKIDNYSKKIEKLIEETESNRSNQEFLTKQLLAQKYLNPDAILNEIKIFLVRFEIEYDILKELLAEIPENSLLIIQSEIKKIRIVSNTEHIKSNKLIEKLIEKYQGRGGGNPRNAQCLLEHDPKDIIKDIQLIIIESVKI